MRTEEHGYITFPEDDQKTEEPKKINFLEGESTAKKNRPKKLRIVLVASIFLTILTIAGCLKYTNIKSHEARMPIDYDPITLAPKEPDGILNKLGFYVFNRDPELRGEKDDRINILILGIGGAGHDGPYLTDTILLASFKPSTKQISLLSIPRDLAVNIPKHGGPYKINSADAFGELESEGNGPVVTSKIVEEVLGVTIHYYARLDFEAFEKIIDAVGGLKISVDRSFTDYEYPAPKELFQTVSFEKGSTLMDGKMALTFARSRHGNNGEGSDFARARRQQKIILALKEKILSFDTVLNPLRLSEILDVLKDHVHTNLAFSEMMSFLKIGRSLNTNEFSTAVLDDGETGFLKQSTGTSGAFLLVPKKGDFSDIQNFVATVFDNKEIEKNNDTPTQENPPEKSLTYSPIIEIQNGTWRAGLAAQLKKDLVEKKFRVETIGNTKERPYAQSGIYILGGSNCVPTAQLLNRELSIPIKTDTPAFAAQASSTDVLVIIGEDFKN